MTMSRRALVAGAGGFIGHHLVKFLLAQGYWVRGVDIREPEFEPSPADEFMSADLREYQACLAATKDIEEVYDLAADMGGIGYITESHADIARNNILINCQLLEASRANGVSRFLFSSSACVYPSYKQLDVDVSPLTEDDAYPADPEPGYGWEKLFTEELCTIISRTLGWKRGSCGFTTCMGPWVRTTVARKRPLPLCAVSWRSPTMARSLRSGEMVSRPARSCTSPTVSKASTGSHGRTIGARLTSGLTVSLPSTSWSESSAGSPVRASSWSTFSTSLRACGGGTATTAAFGRCLDGSLPSIWRRA
jgi:hypothetical protein